MMKEPFWVMKSLFTYPCETIEIYDKVYVHIIEIGKDDIGQLYWRKHDGIHNTFSIWYKFDTSVPCLFLKENIINGSPTSHYQAG